MSADINAYRNSNRPDDADANLGWIIRRAPAEGTMKLVLLSREILGLQTHFYLGRTGPCLRDKCDACRRNHLARWKGYLLAKDVSTMSQIVFEFTPPGVKSLVDAQKTYGTMRGLQIIVSRIGKKANSRVNIFVKGWTHIDERDMTDYNVWPILSMIWGLDMHAPKKEVGHKFEDMSDFDKSTLPIDLGDRP